MLLVIILLPVLTILGITAPGQKLQALVHSCLQMQVYIPLWSPLVGMFKRRIRLSLKHSIILDLISTVVVFVQQTQLRKKEAG